MVDELLKSDWVIERLLVASRAHDQFAPRAVQRDVPLTLISDEIAAYLSDAESSQGVLAVVRRPRPLPCHAQQSWQEGAGPLVILDAVADPGNVGVVIRTALAFACPAVVLLEDCADPFNPKAVRATAGSLFHLPVVVTPLAQLLAAREQRPPRLVVAAARGGRPPWQVELTGNVALVVGSEAHGVRDTILQLADALVTVPVSARAESLNVATAAAAILFEAARQRATRRT